MITVSWHGHNRKYRHDSHQLQTIIVTLIIINIFPLDQVANHMYLSIMTINGYNDLSLWLSMLVILKVDSNIIMFLVSFHMTVCDIFTIVTLSIFQF